MAGARGIVPDDNRVFDPELLTEEVIRYTHYMPHEWMHSKQVSICAHVSRLLKLIFIFAKVHQEFGELFAMKIAIIMQEPVSVVLTPFVFWFSLPQCAPAIIDFLHDFTVHMPGRGYVFSFAEFDFVRHGNVKVRSSTRDSEERANVITN